MRGTPTPPPRRRRMLAQRAAARVAAITALLVPAAVIYTIVQTGPSSSAPAGSTTRTVTGPATARTTRARGSAAASPPARACAPQCAHVVPRLFTALPRSWHKQIRRYPSRALLTLTSPSGAKIYIYYTRSPSVPRIRHFRGSRVARIPRGERWTFRAAFCRHRCTDYLLDVGRRGIVILTRSIRRGTLATAARIARTVR